MPPPDPTLGFMEGVGTQYLPVQAISGHNKAPQGEACNGGRRGVFKTSLEAVGTTGERSRLSSEISPGSLHSSDPLAFLK